MKKLYKALLSLAVVCIFIAIIFMFSEQPGSESHSLSKDVSYKIVSVMLKNSPSGISPEMLEKVAGFFDFPVRKCAHVCIYLGLGFIITTAVWFVFDYDLHFWQLFLIVLAVFLVGCADETVQFFSGGRGATIKDAFIDTFGGMLGIYAHFIARDFVIHMIHGVKKIKKK